MKWFEENKHVIVMLLLLVAIFVLYKYMSSELDTYRTNMTTVDVLTEKNRLISQIDEKKLAEEVEKLQEIADKASVLFIDGSRPEYEIDSFLFKYVKSLMENVGASEFKSVKVSKIAKDKKNPMWGIVIVSVDGVKGPKTYNGVINMLKRIENADKMIMLSNVSIKYSQGENYPYTLSFKMQFPVVVMGGEGK
ncbi:hypothetical protein GM182_04735 [bacterium 3DAC]|jgi:hypothetical protein|nr:hypothetical protein [Dictyoglomota bacterium]UZN23192.1 hypothetical protein GM182_04735 [bacterium 3DAC]